MLVPIITIGLALLTDRSWKSQKELYGAGGGRISDAVGARLAKEALKARGQGNDRIWKLKVRALKKWWEKRDELTPGWEPTDPNIKALQGIIAAEGQQQVAAFMDNLGFNPPPFCATDKTLTIATGSRLAREAQAARERGDEQAWQEGHDAYAEWRKKMYECVIDWDWENKLKDPHVIRMEDVFDAESRARVKAWMKEMNQSGIGFG